MSTTRPGVTVCDFAALLLGALGHRDDEFVSIGHDADGQFHTAVGSPTKRPR